MPSSKKNKLCFFAGSPFFQKEQLKNTLEPIDDCEIESFSAEDFNPEFFFSFINSPSLFQENKAAVVKKTDKIKGAAEIIAKCGECLETNLILLSEEVKIGKEISKALNSAGFEILIEKKADKYNLRGKILQMFTNAGFKIDSASAEELNEIFQGDLTQIANEIEKLSLYFAYKKPQSTSEIMSAVTARKQDNIFTFIDAFTARQRNTCNTLMGRFLSNGENLNILVALLFKRMRDVYLFASLKEQLKENRPWMLEKLKTGIRAWQKEDLFMLYGFFAELDYKNKTGQISVENYVTALISKL
ncbi:MAG: hypothetical protein C0602_02120 [Denitrovibrio sp.]|nr:MAG: hypothetical protein C0602_02120 [Denitrovibrio sp.]